MRRDFLSLEGERTERMLGGVAEEEREDRELKGKHRRERVA
jgi:hypothetical protein